MDNLSCIVLKGEEGMQVSKIAVFNQFSANKNQKSPAFGDRITVLTHKSPNIEGTMNALLEQTGITHGLEIEIGDVKSALVCKDGPANKLAEYFVSLSNEVRLALGIDYEGKALEPILAARRKFHPSSSSNDSKLPPTVKQRFLLDELIPKWPNVHQ